MNIPNSLTFLRIGLIPVFVLVFYAPLDWGRQLACLIFVAAALTDLLDGYLARKLRQTSQLGAFLDPVADKLIVCVALVLLVSRGGSLWLAAPACVIIGRELVISALREWLAGTRARARLAVSRLGKVKTVSQFLALLLLLWSGAAPAHPLYLWGCGLLLAAAALTLVSMAYYLLLARRAPAPGPR